MNVKHLVGWLHRHGFWIIVGLTAISAVTWSLHYHAQGLNGLQSGLKGIFAALQFLVLNKELDDGLAPWQWWTLSATQLLTPLFASLALISAIFREHLEPLWLQLEMSTLAQDSFWLVVGSQAMSTSLVPALHSAGRKILVLDAPQLVAGQRSGTWHLQRDLQGAHVFKDLPIHRAQGVVLALDDEELNLRLLQQLQEKMEQSAKKEALLVHCRVQSHALLQLFMDQPGLSLCNHPLLDVRPLHVPMLQARGLTQHAGLTTTAPRGIAIVGTSELACALVVRLARIGITSPSQPLQLFWIAEDSCAALKQLVMSYPALRSALRPSADQPGQLELPHLRLTTWSGNVSTWTEQCLAAPDTTPLWPDLIYTVHESSALNLMDARTLQIHGGVTGAAEDLRTRIVALVGPGILEPASVPHPELPWRCQIELLQPDALLCNSLVHDSADAMAQSYDAIWSQAARIDIAAWRNLPFAVKESNRDIADHLPWKLAHAGLRPQDIAAILDPSVPVSEQVLAQLNTLLDSDALLNDLIRMEQMRYRAFMTLQGFKPCPTDMCLPQSIAARSRKQIERALRINPTLGMALESLPPDEVDKDRNIIQHTPEVIRVAKQPSTQGVSVTGT